MRQITILLAAALIAATSGADAMWANVRTVGLGPGAAISGVITTPGQVDCYRLDVVAGRTYVVETFDVVRGSGEGTYLSVYDAGGGIAARGSPADGDADRTLEITAPADGSLEIRVTGHGAWVGGYRLRALAARGEPGAAWDARGEPDGRYSLGHSLAVGEPIWGDIAAASPAAISRYPDGDSYARDLAGGRTYLIVVDGLPADAPAGAVFLVLSEVASELVVGGERSGAGGAPAQMIVAPRASTRYCQGVSGLEATPWSGAYRVRAVEMMARALLPLVAR
jgi:hypothetical protein